MAMGVIVGGVILPSTMLPISTLHAVARCDGWGAAAAVVLPLRTAVVPVVAV